MTPSTNETKDSAVRQLKVQRTVFNLDEFESVTVGKMVPFKPVGSVEEALSELNSDTSKLLELINKGREASVRDAAYNQNDGWFDLDDSNAVTKEPFDGTITEPKHVNQTVSVLAKTIFGYNKDMKKEDKAAAKKNAMDMVRNTETIREGLKKRALSAASEE